MADKAYIVANKEQEFDVLYQFEERGFVWASGEQPTEWSPSEKAFGLYNFDFPYVISFEDDESIAWFLIEEIEDETIVYDGRKEEK